MITLSIIVVNYNTKELLKKCVESILKNKGNIKLEIIVVDNASTDGSKEYLKSQNLKLVLNNQNFGFARANNQGIKEASGKYILLLNSDTEVKPSSLKWLVGFAEGRPDVGVVGARLLNHDGSIQPSVYQLPSVWGAVKEYWFGRSGAYEKYFPPGDEPVEVEAVVGAVMLTPKTTIEKVGLLDERYFMYFEDLDYCRRVKQSGLKIYYFPASVVTHYHGESGKTIPNKTRSWLVDSSKRYNGLLNYYIINLIIRVFNVLRFRK